MTNAQLKAAIKANGYTLKEFAEVLGVAYVTLRKSLSDSKPVSEQLRRHIMLALKDRGFNPQAVYHPAINNGVVPEPIPFTPSLTIPAEILPILDKAAEQQGISFEEYIENACILFAKQMARGIINGRIIRGE